MKTHCPLYLAAGKSMACACLPKFRFAAVGKPNNPCPACQLAWSDGQPPTPADKGTWTPVLLQLSTVQLGKSTTTATPRVEPRLPVFMAPYAEPLLPIFVLPDDAGPDYIVEDATD